MGVSQVDAGDVMATSASDPCQAYIGNRQKSYRNAIANVAVLNDLDGA